MGCFKDYSIDELLFSLKQFTEEFENYKKHGDLLRFRLARDEIRDMLREIEKRYCVYVVKGGEIIKYD